MQTSLRHRWMSALWAAFLSAAVLEMLVFALVDPQQLRWFGGDVIELSPNAVYTLAFFAFWAVTSVGAGLAILLSSRPADARDAAPADLRTR